MATCSGFRKRGGGDCLVAVAIVRSDSVQITKALVGDSLAFRAKRVAGVSWPGATFDGIAGRRSDREATMRSAIRTRP